MEFLLSGRTTTSSRRTDSMQMAQEIGSSDDSRSMVGLTQLCDRLNMASPLAVSFINPTTLVPPILSCLQKEYNPELMLLAARALTYLSDSVPKTLEILASNGNVDVLLHHLLSIQDVELSEQCLTCVEKICQAPFGAATVLKKGGIAAMLGFMDFFTIVSQRKIWMNTARMCRWVTPANFHLVKESLPIIRHACSHEDSKARHHAVMALLRILTGVHGNAKLVAEVFHDLDHTLLSIFDRGDSSEPSFSAALAVVQLAVASSEEVTRVLVESSTLFPFLLTLLKGSVGGTEGVAAFGSGGGQGYAFNHNGSFAVDGSSPLSPSIPSTGNASASGRGGLSMEQVKTLCAIFSSTLPTPRQNLLMYVNSLRQLEVEESGADRRDASTSLPHEESSNSAAGEEDNANEEEELNNTHDEDQWESDEDVDDLRTRIEGCEEIQRETNMVHARCVFGNHICSRCSKMLGLKDWYRCNQCRDYDLCCRCLLDAADVHFDGNHSFTDMHVIFPNGAAPHAVSPTETEKAKVAIFANPKLMESALAPLPSIVQLIISCESAQTRIQCINYLVSAVALANAQQLCGANVLASPISEAITTAVADPRITLNLLGVELTNLLLTKLPEHYCELFVREGVHHALDQLQKRFSERETNATRAKSAKAKTEEAAEPCSSMELEKLISTLGGWRRAISDRADSVKLRLPVAGKQSREVLLHDVVAKLRADAYEEAFNQLRGILLADTTTFELLSSHIVSELRAALQRSGDVHVILRLVATLLTTSTGKVDLPNSAVLRFIRHLHTMISHTENFQPPPLGPIRSINTQISLSLVPHGTDSGSSSASSPLAVRSRTSGGSGSDRSSSTQGGGVEVPKRTVTVSIEPLAAIWAVSSFVAGQLLSTGGRRSTRDSESPNESERLEEVLPDLMGEEEEDGVPTRESSTSNMRQQREENAPPQVWIRCGNHILPPTMTILQVVQHLGMQRTPKPAARRGTATRGGRGLPAEVQEALEALRNATTPNEQIVFHYSATPFVGSEYTMLSVFGKLKPPTQATLGLPSTDHRHPLEEAVMAALHNSFFFSATFLSEEQKDILIILGLLHECLLHWPALLRACGGGAGSLLDPSTLDDVGATTLGLLPEFPHPKLNAKAMRHCSNLLMAGQHIKVWAVPLAMDCNFLFYPSTRKFLFETSFFGTHRSLVRMQQNADAHRIRNAGLSTEETSTRTYRLVRHKKRVWREKVIECAMKVLGGRRSSGSVVWEFQFYNEAGSGLGPTREFYTLVAEALRERSRALWMSSGEGPDEKYYTPTNGLYPGVLNSEQEAAKGETVQKTFRFLGRFIARAILDEHVPGLPLSPVLIKMLRGDRCDVYDVQELNPAIGNVLVALCEAHATGSSTIRLPGQRSSFSIESLDLTFVLPVEGGCVELVPGGASMAVNATNAMSYCDAMVAMLLGRGVHRAVAGLREGFDDYIPIIALRMITGEEFHEVLNGYGEHISQTELEENCCADHGFTMSCHHVQWLLEIVASFSVEDQRKFFLFLTGSPRLPVGGVRNLRPKFTIVRKTATEDSVKEGDQLPSAMTCQNYLKLPAYESKELMERKLRQAVSEGAGAFLLT